MGIGKTFTNLAELFISGESVKFEERKDFASMSQLTKLSMKELSIDFLPDGLLNDLPNLKWVSMESCKTDKVPKKLFVNQKRLELLSFFGNSLTVLEKDLFEFNLRLKYVDFFGNNLERIFVDFLKLTAIDWIDLRDSECLSRYYDDFYGDQIESLQNAVISCCGAKATVRPSNGPNCICFPKTCGIGLGHKPVKVVLIT